MKCFEKYFTPPEAFPPFFRLVRVRFKEENVRHSSSNPAV